VGGVVRDTNYRKVVMFNLDDKLRELEMAEIDRMLNDQKSYACPECGIVTQCYTNCPIGAHHE